MKNIFTLFLLLIGNVLVAQDPKISIEDDRDAYVPNEFVGSFTMEMHTFKKGVEEKDSPMNVHFWSKEDMILMQPEVEKKGGEMKILTDLKNKYQYTLMTDEDGERTGIRQPKKKITVENEDEKGEDMNVKKTDATRTIEGHLCHEYVGSNSDGKWTAWVADDIEAPFQQMIQNMSGVAGSKKEPAAEVPEDAFPLESTWESADGKEKMVMYVKDLKVGSVDESVFDISGYEIMEMPSMPGMNFGQ